MSNRIKEIRSSMEITQEQFADRFDLDQNDVLKWESQENDPDESVATKISEKTNLPLDFIYGKKFNITKPVGKWEEDQLEDFASANSMAQEVLKFRFGHGVFDNEKEKPTNEGELEEDMFVWHRNGETGREKLSNEEFNAIVNLIKTISEKPKDI